MPLKVSTAQFVDDWHRLGAQGVADKHGLSLRNVLARRQRLAKSGIDLPTRPALGYESRTPVQYRNDGWTHERERRLDIENGSIVVFSDSHYWPGEPSVAHKALLAVIKMVKPRVVIANGDVFDGGSISRHAAFGWGTKPSPLDELHACMERMGEIEQAVPRGCQLYWNMGNHCIRWERTLVEKAEQFRGLHGARLDDHFPAWTFQWSVMVNRQTDHPVMIKHRYAGGIHAAYNNTIKGGISIVTGHTHILEVKPWVDYRGRRWGVQTGTLADHDGPQFEYTENSPSPACSGFAVLTFRDGRLLPPELCEVIDHKAHFRGGVVA